MTRHHGDLLDQPVEAIVNPWNRNYMPRWLLIPHGVSGALKKRTGPEPWRDLKRRGVLALGDAVVTDAGRLEGIDYLIHVAGLNLWWRATRAGVTLGTRNAIDQAARLGVRSLAIPLIGAGTGGLTEQASFEAITAGLAAYPTWAPDTAAPSLQVRIVSYDNRPADREASSSDDLSVP